MDLREVLFFSTGVDADTDPAVMVPPVVGNGGKVLGTLFLAKVILCGDGDRRTGYLES